MHVKKACLVVDIREGLDMAKVVDLTTVLAAAGWKTDVVLKEYGGEATKLAAKAVKDEYDLIIAYGGDGTLNQVVNGVTDEKGKCIVSDIPAGTANEWAGEIGIPEETMKAALTLINSDARKVDLGRVRVEGLIFPSEPAASEATATSQNATIVQQDEAGKEVHNTKNVEGSTSIRQHFLLMAGLGIDAAVIGHTSKPLKYHFGRLAFNLAALKELPEQHPFPVEIQIVDDSGVNDVIWHGEALQIILANTRRYANVVDIVPDAYLDDGMLNVCVFIAGGPLNTIEQISSLLLRRKPDPGESKYFRDAHFSIRVPASIQMQLDGNTVKLQDYLSKSEREALEQMGDDNAQRVMVDYRFDAEPHAVTMAIPRTYDNTLFEKPLAQNKAYKSRKSKSDKQKTSQSHVSMSNEQTLEGQRAFSVRVRSAIEHGTEMTVVAVGPNPEKDQTYIVAGTTRQKDTDKLEPIAVRVNADTIVTNSSGEHFTLAAIRELQEGMEIVVEGKKGKRGNVKAKHVIV